MATAQPVNRKRDPSEHVDLEPSRPPPNGTIHESKKRQRSPEKLDRDTDRQKRPRRDDERRDDRRESERPGADRDRRNGDRHERDRRERDGDRHDRDRRGEGRYDRDKRDGDRRHGDRRDADRKERDRDPSHSERRSPLPPSSKPPSSKPTLPPNRHPTSGSSSTAQPEIKQEPLDSEEEEAALMKKLMGFATFKSTKNTKVPGNDKLYGVRKEKKTEYRQYMNRVGGFNRPLSPSR